MELWKYGNLKVWNIIACWKYETVGAWKCESLEGSEGSVRSNVIWKCMEPYEYGFFENVELSQYVIMERCKYGNVDCWKAVRTGIRYCSRCLVGDPP